MNAAPAPAPRNEAFDLLRVALCGLVVVWHEKSFGPSALAPPGARSWADLSLVDFFYFDVSLLAVPGFLALSGWLIADRIQDGAFRRARLKRLGLLFLFWSALYSVVFRVAPFCATASLGCYTQRLLTGNLSYATYYLLILMMQDGVLAFLGRAGGRVAIAVCGVLTAGFLVTSVLGLSGRAPSLSAFYSPLSFAALPVGVCLAKRFETRFATRRAALFLGGLSLLAAA